MTERDNNIENLLGLTEYPSSSDDENNVPRATATQGWHQPPPQQAQTSRDADEVINLDESPSPAASSPADQVESTPTSSTVDQRREQARIDRDLFWSAINNPQRLNTSIRPAAFAGCSIHSTHGLPSSGPGETGPRPALFGQRAAAAAPRAEARLHAPVAELSQPPLPPSSSADMMIITAFRRLQRYRTYRRNRASSLGMVSRLPPLDPRDSSPRSRYGRSASGTYLNHSIPYHRLIPPMMNYGGGSRAEGGGPAERSPDDNANQNDARAIENDHSADETESGRLSPRLPVPVEEPQDNSDNMEVDEGPAAGGDDDESEAESAAASPAPSAGNGNNSQPEVGRVLNSLLGDVRRWSRGQKRRRESERQRAEAFNVKEFNQNLLRLLECPVCLEWMEPPMLQCRLGHLVCARCRARLTTCPVCRSGFSSVRNRAMEGVADLLRYPCRHGCGKETRCRRRAAHEASCPRRKYRCPANACGERAPLPYDDLVRHVQRNHAAMIKTGRVHKFSVKVNTQQHDNWLIMAGFGLFHLRIAVDIRTWSILAYVAYIGPKCRAKEFTYQVTVVGQHNGRKLVYTRATHSDLESSSLNVSRQDCFHITLDEAINFLRFRNRHCQPDRLLDLTLEISKQEAIVDDSNPVISD